ncbi:MAG: shikimate kinase [Clostridia bacterium]|nr:shikimate kinase [Clostridia bacterium]
MKTGYKQMRCGLLGEHLGHSFSPQIHAAIADYGYDLVELPQEQVGEFVKHGGYDAFNVTIPYKQTVIPFLNTVSPEADRIGAVNTVVRHSDGTVHGYNTDYFGFSYMIDRLGIDVRGKKAMVLGTGGASLTARTVLSDRGVRELVVIGIEDNTPENLALHSDTEIIVNATPVGMYPHTGKTPVSLSLFPQCLAVLDVIYNPARTALILEAEERKIPYINGLYMLVAQAVKAFEFFTGDPAEEGIIDVITKQIEDQTRNIILIGMPGCGKSTAGRLLADQMDRPFYDADDEFTAMHDMTPAQAIRELGEDRFRQMEHLVLCELGKKSGTVIACGGGVITREYNYAPLHQNGVILYLKRELSRLATDGRPLSQKTSVEALFAARKEGYERFADLQIQNTEIPEKTVDAMLAALARFPE